jgi:hypothetical protein
MWLMVRKPKKYGLTWFINIVSFGRPLLLLLILTFNRIKLRG